jgi:hypothetical protein
MIANSNDADKLERTLSGIALSPQLLIPYVKLHRERATLQRKRRSKGAKKVKGARLALEEKPS